MHRFRAASVSAFLLLLIIVSMIGTACSRSNPSLPSPTTPKAPDASGSIHQLLGYYQCTINADGSIDVVYDREAVIHVDVTPFLQPPQCFDCVSFQVLEFKPATGHLLVAVTLKNPTPLSGFDVRGILMSDADPPHDILNRDGYTDLWDNGGPIDRNPFIWFDNENSFDGGASRTEIFQLKMPVPPNFQFAYAVDASWPGHCGEPYALNGRITEQIVIVVYAKDWQDDVTSVTADTTDLDGSLEELVYSDEYGAWFGGADNTMGLPQGEHTMWVWAESPNNQNVILYQKLNYRIGESLGVTDGWPVERRHIRGHGKALYGGPVDGELKWTYPFTDTTWDSSLITSPIADQDGNVYVSLPEMLTAINLSGNEKWSFPVNGVTATFTPFLRGDGIIIWPVNRQLAGYDLGMLYFINESGGTAEMPVLLPGTVNAPAIPDREDNILIPIENGLYQCDLKGYPVWQYIPGDGQATIPRPVSVVEDFLSVVTDCTGPDTEFIFLNKYGNEMWSVPLNGTPLCQPIAEYTYSGIFVCSSAKDIPQLDKFGIQARYPGGDPMWPGPYFNFKGFTHFALAADLSNYIYGTGFGDELIYSVSAGGGTYWKGFTPFGILQDNISAPTICWFNRIYAGGEITVAAVHYSFFAGIQNDWTPLWTFQEEGRGFVGSPVIALDGYVHCLGLDPDLTLQLYCFGEK